MSEPASGAQIGYVIGLSRQLHKLLEEQDTPEAVEAREKLKEAQSGQLTKKAASQLLDVLIRTVEAFGGDASPRKPDNVVSMADPYAVRRQKQRERQRMTAIAYERAQVEQFGGSRHRDPLDGTGKTMKVWKARVNHMQFRWGDTPEVIHGWAWECSHPDHEGYGSGRVRGGSMMGYAQTMTNAHAHIKKYHNRKDGT